MIPIVNHHTKHQPEKMIKMHWNFFWEGFPQIPGMLNSLVLGFDVHLHQQPRSTSTQSMASNRSCVPIHTAGALLSFKIPNPGATEIHPTFLLPRKKLTWQKTRCNLWWFIDSLTCFSSGRINLWSANMKLFGQFRQGFPSQPTTLKLDGKVNCLYWEWVCSSWKIQDFHTTTLMNKLIGNVNQTATQPWVSHGISDRLKWYPALSRHHFKLWYPTMSFYLYTNNWESDNLFFAKRSCVDFFESKWTLILPSANLSRSLYAILSNLQPCENTETHAEGHRMVWSWPALIATWLFQSAATAHLTGRVGVPKNVLGKIPRIHCVKRKMQTIPSLASPTHRLYDSPKTKFPEVLCS